MDKTFYIQKKYIGTKKWEKYVPINKRKREFQKKASGPKMCRIKTS